jgi:membrane-associated phospholipid phosphatase
MRTFLNPVDRLSVVFIAVLAIVTLISVTAVSARQQFIFQYALFTIVIVLLVFNSLGDLIPRIRPRYYDDVLIRIDYSLFGVHPTVWMERFNNALLTGLLQTAYISYYFMPISLGVLLFIREKRSSFNTAVFGIVLCFYLSYLGYLLVPAVGPRFTLNHVQMTELQAGPLTLWIRQTLDGLEQNKTDAFPSGHTAVALVSLVYAWKYREKALFRILAPAVSGLIVSTVYLRYHYVVDVIAGILLAVLTILISPRMYRFFSGSPGQSQG